MVLAISDISVLSLEQQGALEMENLLCSLAASPFQPSARTCPSMNLGRVNRRSLRTWTLIREAGSNLVAFDISLHVGSLTGFAVQDASRFPGGRNTVPGGCCCQKSSTKPITMSACNVHCTEPPPKENHACKEKSKFDRKITCTRFLIHSW